MKHLFRPEERNAIEDKFGDDLLFEAMRTPCLSLLNASKTFALHPCELFYHVLFTIDEIKSRTIAEATMRCDKALWDDLLNHLRERVGEEYPTEARQATGMIMYATAMTLIWSGNPIYTSISGVLIKRVKEQLPDFSLTLYQKFVDGFNVAEKDKLCQSINDYLKSNREISTEIDRVLDFVPEEDTIFLHEDSQTAVNIAPRKKTAVIVVLEAMYKAEWFVDANGNPLSNRNDTILRILKAAFGERKANIDQLLSSLKNKNKGRNREDIFDELINQK